MTPVALVILTLLLSAFFSGLEIAFISANKLRIELKSNQGAHWAQLCSNYLKSPSKFISTILVGNNISLVIYGITMEEILRPRFELFYSAYIESTAMPALITATLISTGIVLITAEFLPKALFRLNPSGILRFLIYPFQVFYVLLWPIVVFVIWLSNSVLSKLMNTDFTEKTPAFGKVDLDHFISQSAQNNTEGEEPEVDTDILKNALDFGNVKVRDCLVPRTEITAIDIQSTIPELEELFVESQHSKILVYKENVDNIIGYVHHLELHKKPQSIKSILIPILITNESKSANDMLNEFSKTQKSIALVVDEYGGTSGIVSLEDIIEEIVGDITDEFDDEDVYYSKLNDNNYIFEGKTPLVDLYKILEIDGAKFEEEKGESDTIAGFMLELTGKFPDKTEKINFENYTFSVETRDKRRIKRIKLTINEPEHESGE